MHAVRTHTLDLGRRRLLFDGQHVRELTGLQQTGAGLHYANDVPDHPHLKHVESHLLPGLDLVVTRFHQLPDSPFPSRFYLDMATIAPGPEIWTVRDLYLDVVVRPDGVPALWDVDEYAEAVLEGHLTPNEQRRALVSAGRVVNGLFAHGNSLDAWLESLGIQLAWWMPGPALHSPS